MLTTSCWGKQNNTSENRVTSEQNDQANADQKEMAQGGVILSISPETYPAPPDMVKLKIVNNTDTIIQFGASYMIERYVGNNWTKVEFSENIAFIDIMYGLSSGESNEYDIFLYPATIPYTSGRYRIVKSILMNDERKNYSAEFVIE